jgi:hypothetical protein
LFWPLLKFSPLPNPWSSWSNRHRVHLLSNIYFNTRWYKCLWEGLCLCEVSWWCIIYICIYIYVYAYTYTYTYTQVFSAILYIWSFHVLSTVSIPSGVPHSCLWFGHELSCSCSSLIVDTSVPNRTPSWCVSISYRYDP